MVENKHYIVFSSHVALRYTTEDDLDFVLQAEHADEHKPFISQWTREEHLVALTNTNIAHLIVENTIEKKRIGYMILIGLQNPKHIIESRRFVITDKGKGHGRMARRLAKQIVFEDFHACRLWLDVVEYNMRARHLDESEGFLVERAIMQALREGEEPQQFLIMSISSEDYFAKNACGENT